MFVQSEEKNKISSLLGFFPTLRIKNILISFLRPITFVMFVSCRANNFTICVHGRQILRVQITPYMQLSPEFNWPFSKLFPLIAKFNGSS